MLSQRYHQKRPFTSSCLCTTPSGDGGELGKATGLGFSALLLGQWSLTFNIKKWKKSVTETLGSSTEREFVILGAVQPSSRNSVCPIPQRPGCSWCLCLPMARALSTSPCPTEPGPGAARGCCTHSIAFPDSSKSLARRPVPHRLVTQKPAGCCKPSALGLMSSRPSADPREGGGSLVPQ